MERASPSLPSRLMTAVEPSGGISTTGPVLTAKPSVARHDRRRPPAHCADRHVDGSAGTIRLPLPVVPLRRKRRALQLGPRRHRRRVPPRREGRREDDRRHGLARRTRPEPRPRTQASSARLRATPHFSSLPRSPSSAGLPSREARPHLDRCLEPDAGEDHVRVASLQWLRPRLRPDRRCDGQLVHRSAARTSATRSWRSCRPRSDRRRRRAFSIATPPSLPQESLGRRASPGRPITGTAAQGRQLTASPGTWSGLGPITFAYQWYRCDQTGSHCTLIRGSSKPDVHARPTGRRQDDRSEVAGDRRERCLDDLRKPGRPDRPLTGGADRDRPAHDRRRSASRTEARRLSGNVVAGAHLGCIRLAALQLERPHLRPDRGRDSIHVCGHGRRRRPRTGGDRHRLFGRWSAERLQHDRRRSLSREDGRSGGCGGRQRGRHPAHRFFEQGARGAEVEPRKALDRRCRRSGPN